MGKTHVKNHAHSIVIIIAVILVVFLQNSDAHVDIGACYGTLGDNLPPPSQVLALARANNIGRIRIYNPDPSILEALGQYPDIAVVIGVVNNDIPAIARDPAVANAWVEDNILKYSTVNFRYISVGNEISPSADPPTAAICPSVSGAMQNIHDAISSAGLADKIKISTALSYAVMGVSYPPSAGTFNPDFGGYINPIIEFLVKTDSPFLINTYPYFSYAGNPQDISLAYALFTSPGTVVVDGPYNYQNLFDAMVDAVYAALEKAGADGVDVVVTETGWPTAGGVDTTLANGKIYNNKVINHRGTPRKPDKKVETYIFDLMDEDEKSSLLERSWGMFYANKVPKYPLQSFYETNQHRPRFARGIWRTRFARGIWSMDPWGLPKILP